MSAKRKADMTSDELSRKRARQRKANMTPEQWEKVLEQSRVRVFKNKYGITVEDREKMLVAQGFKCANAACDHIDGFAPGNMGRLHVDHSHKTGRVRGLLCSFCNFTLGHTFDDPKILAGLIAYLGEHSE